VSAPVLRFDHAHLRSPDPDAAARFYVEVLGGTRRARDETPESLRVTVDLGGLALFIDRLRPERDGPPEPPFRGLEHLGFAVDDVDAAIAAAEALGAVVSVRPHSPKPGLRIAFLTGPDGVRIELLRRP
jgi:catechol 2,3-dioxygenase-like lactoylglutathione lyase family enzyme